MNWQIYLLIGIIAASVCALLQKTVVTKKSVDPILFSAAFQLSVALILGIVAFIKGFNIPANLAPIALNLILMPALYTLGNIAKFKSLKSIDASEFTVIIQASTVISVIAAVFLLNESFVYKQILGLLLVVAAVLLVTLKDKIHFKFSKGEFWGIVAAIAMGLAFVNDAYILRSFDVYSYAFLAFLSPGIITLAFTGHNRLAGFKNLATKKIAYKFGGAALIFAIGTIAVYSAYNLGRNAAQISSIFQTSTILIVILAAIFLRERKHLFKKFAAAIISIIGVILLQ